MSNSGYLRHLRNQSDKDFLKTFDIAYAIKETNQQIQSIQNNIDGVNQQITSLQQQLKSASRETKKQLVSQMKDLGSQKNNLTQEMNNLLNIINGSDGLNDKLSRLSSDESLSPSNWINYMTNTAINNKELKTRFETLMASNQDKQYLSEYAKNMRLGEREGNVFHRLSSLPSFQERNLPVTQKALQDPLINENIRSFMKQDEDAIRENYKRGGKKRTNKKSKTNKRKSRKINKKSRKMRYHKK